MSHLVVSYIASGRYAHLDSSVINVMEQHSAPHSKAHELPGYSGWKNGLILPHDLVTCLREQRDQPDSTNAPEASVASNIEPAAESTSQEPTSSKAATQSRRQRSPSGMKRVFSAEHVRSFAERTELYQRGSERAKTMTGMLKGLQREPVGMREVMRLPRNLDTLLATLETEMPNFSEVIDAIRTLLMLQKAGDKVIQLPPLLLGGDPGVGKTYFANRLASALGLVSEVVHMETASASFILTGGNLTWSNGAPGRVFDLMVHGKQANPMLVLDELDKTNGSPRYNPANSLYALLEPGTAKEFCDESAPDVPLDVTGINWIVTANRVHLIPSPLRNRMREFHVPMPTYEQKLMIAACVYRDMRKDNAWGKHFSPTLNPATARALLGCKGSVRTIRTALLSAFANAIQRQSDVVEPADVRKFMSTMGSDSEYGNHTVGFLAPV